MLSRLTGLKQPFSIEHQLVISFAILGLLISVAFSITFYSYHNKALLAGIDNQLKTAALMARATLPDDYHDRIQGKTSVSDADYGAIVDRYNHLCDTLGMAYLWSVMLLDGQVVFTTATSPDKDVTQGKHARFLESHSNPELYLTALEKRTPTYQIHDDKWGRIRAVLIPFKDKHGRPFLFGASMHLTDLDRQLRSTLNECLLFSSLALGLSVLLGIYLARSMAYPLRQLVSLIERIKQGEHTLKAEEKGTREQRSLAQCFNRLNGSLQENTRILERKNRELENLVYVTSHDLRSPLLNIQGFSRKIESLCAELQSSLASVEPAETREAMLNLTGERIPKSLHFILTSVDKMDHLISGLLKISRLGTSMLTRTRLDMNPMFRDILAVQAYAIQSMEAQVTVHNLPSCEGDSTMINQIFSNLLENALKYRDLNRRLQITISGRTEGGHVVYCMEDNGLGIAAEHRERIWEIFHRLQPGNSIAGEGLGLCMVRRAVERHQGETWVESTPGRGSRFYVKLPCAAEKPPANK